MRRATSALALAGILALVAGCTSEVGTAQTTDISSPVTTTVEADVDLPEVRAVDLPETELASHSLIELVVDLEADYDNPFEQREVSLDAIFTGPSATTIHLPGFWDGEGSWRLRFTPSTEGEWDYAVTVTDHRGASEEKTGTITVAPSDHPGFIRVGNQVNPDYSPRYFAYEDGTSWYGRGHASLDMSLGGASPDGDGLAKFSEMIEVGENYEMWWPMWGNNFIQDSYDNYSPAQMNVIDFVVRDAEAKGIALVYTIWGHQFLRTPAHDWPDERWNFNGFSELTDIAGFFTDAEAWAWQENYYRYILARWSYSPAILMWQTVTEVNGTESYDQTDPWHERVNAYYQTNDPYRHPTTATKSGAQDWPEGHAVMDVPQVHLYHVFGDNPIADTIHFADWTTLMWEREVKPNWIGEYGNRVQALYPEFMHHANWASLATGAAMTPTEWNDLNAFGSFDAEMRADMRRFADFVDRVPLAVYDPEKVRVDLDHPEVRGWGIAGNTGGVLWVQDHALDEATIEEIRADDTVREGLTATIADLTAGSWNVTPYDTWSGEWLDAYIVECPGGPCEIPLPGFHSDLAFHVAR
jgi:hypothetical protein